MESSETSHYPQALPLPCLTFVGVGPGDPSLLTIAAIRAIKNATLISYPISKLGDESLAANIASEWISKEKKCLPLVFPMVLEGTPRKEAWKDAGNQLASAVKDGENVVFLTQGDVSLFASSAYVVMDLKKNHPECNFKLIPGVTSFSAAAASGQFPLSLQQEQLLVSPTPDSPEVLESLIHSAAENNQVLALLKLGRRWVWVRPLLERMGILNEALFAQKIGFEDQKIQNARSVDANERTYLSLLILRQGWPQVMP